ncbi:MAG: hypothetical protein HKN94_03360 [Acidimicrobiales bacterium]|nr:hypothetical protein [Acidimicrobiales bacterium]RZV46073.1 MAG: hypothetical protein EX269_08200 [Acidimicrobiales bacterium]
MALTDTASLVATKQRQRLASMTMSERADLTVALCEAVTAAAIAGIRHEHPEATNAEVRSQLLRRRYGAEFVASLPPHLR